MKKWLIILCIILLISCTPKNAEQPVENLHPSQQVQKAAQSSIKDLSTTEPPKGFTTVPKMEKLAELPGGHISDIEFSPSSPNILYLASNVNAMGIWKSTDSGETWLRIYYDDQAGTHMNTVRVDPKNPEIVYATDVHGYFSKGLNGQFTRSEISKTALFGLAIDPLQPSNIYLGTEDGMFWKSTDSGETWNKISNVGGTIGPILVDKDNIYVGTRERGLFVSRDLGNTWINEYKDIEIIKIAKVNDIIFLATPVGILRKTTGQFETVMNRNVRTVEIAPSNPMIVYAGTADDAVYKSVDGGTTWIKFSQGIQNLDIGALAINPTNPDMVITGTNIWQWSYHGESFPTSTLGEGIYKTTDGGNNWRKIEGKFYDRDVDTIAVDPNDPNNIYVGTECSRGIYRSLDGGKSFEFINGGPEEGSFDIGHYTMKMVVDSDSNVFLTGRFGITKSTDNGKTWSITGVRRHYHGIAVNPYNSNVIIAGTSPEYFDPAMGPDSSELPGAHIVRSVDGGITWELSETGFPAGTHTSIHDVAFDVNNPNVVYITTTHEEIGLPDTEEALGIYKSIDQGKSWHIVNKGLTSLDVDTVKVSPHNKVFAGTKKGVFVSNDGERWNTTSLKFEVESIVIDTIGTIFVGTTENGVYASLDDGLSWQQVTSIPNAKIMGLTLSKGILYAAVNDYGIYRSIK
ncbi:hypothetical protein HYU23_01890 [Candidatus Woesearchaeota archaeon]|nr:hypothetical protein [Candidatus Woesearchaeota archaeon]